jgi:hypothetical protein
MVSLLRTLFRVAGAKSSGSLETAGALHGESKVLSESAWMMLESPRPPMELAISIASLHTPLASDDDILD